jgi:hypothetical protein
VIDECAAYINEDVANSLDETRKFGLHFVLSHQRIRQLMDVSENCYDAVMANAQTKIVFRINDDESAQVLCKQLFRSEFDIDRPKEILNKPVAVGQEIIELFSSSETHGTTTGHSETDGFGQGESIGTALGEGQRVFDPESGQPLGTTYNTNAVETSGLINSQFSAATRSEAAIHSTTQGSSQSLKTVYEVMPTATYSLEEIVHLGTRTIRELPKRTAFAVFPEQ